LDEEELVHGRADQTPTGCFSTSAISASAADRPLHRNQQASYPSKSTMQQQSLAKQLPTPSGCARSRGGLVRRTPSSISPESLVLPTVRCCSDAGVQGSSCGNYLVCLRCVLENHAHEALMPELPALCRKVISFAQFFAARRGNLLLKKCAGARPSSFSLR
jgi:hypothetical protein